MFWGRIFSWCSSELVIKGRGGRKGRKGRQEEKKKSVGKREGEFFRWGGRGRRRSGGEGERKKGWAGKMRARQRREQDRSKKSSGERKGRGEKVLFKLWHRWEVKKRGKRRKGG